MTKKQKGAICLDTLGTAWSPVLTLKSGLISLQGLLASPEPKDPQDAEVASMMIKDPKGYEFQARQWAVQYAGAPQKNDAESSGDPTAEQLKKGMQEGRNTKEDREAAAYV